MDTFTKTSWFFNSPRLSRGRYITVGSTFRGRVLLSDQAYLGWGRGGLQGAGSGYDLVLGNDLRVLPGCGECLDLCVGYPWTFVVPTAWMDWKWVLRLMSLHICLGVLVSWGCGCFYEGAS